MSIIRVVLVDDHPVVRAGIRALIDGHDDIAVVGEAHDMASAERIVALEKPDVVLMDLSLGDGPGGAEVTARLTSLASPPRVLVLTTYDTEADILAAIEAGATGYLLKDSSPEDLAAAVRAAAAGQTALAPSIAQRLMERARTPAQSLSPRELEVLQLVADGLSTLAISKRLFLSQATVKSHLVHVYTKLGVDSRTSAVAAATEAGLLRR